MVTLHARNRYLYVMHKLIISCLIICFLGQYALAQRKTKLNTHSQGTMFGSIGYNRSIYSGSDADFSSTNYNYQLFGVSFSDHPNGLPLSNYFNSGGGETTQFNATIGYYVAHKWAVTLGVDRLNVFMNYTNETRLSGTFAPGAHSFLEGTYENEPVNFGAEQINYFQSDGVNFISAGLVRSSQLYKSRKARVEILANLGVNFGFLFAQSNYTFDAFTTQRIGGLSGVGFSGNLNARFVFFQHVFIQPQLTGGILNHSNTALSAGKNTTVSHTNGYLSPELRIGFSFFVRPTDGCGTCPQW